MKKSFLARLLLAALLLFPPLSAARAQNAASKPIEFLPENIFTVSYQLKWSAEDGVLSSGFEEKSILKNKLSQNGLASDSVSGNIAYQSFVQYFSVQYGWSPDINIGLTIPYVSRGRKSDLTALQKEGEEFTEANGTLNSQGLGDVEIWGLWRLIYSDGLDFHFGASFNADNGSRGYDEKEELSIGSGAQEISAFLKWRIYSSASDWMADIKATGTVARKSERSDGDLDYSLQRANTFSGLLSVSKSREEFYFGGGLIVENRGETTIDGHKQHDGRLSYSYQLFLNYSNLFLLEKSPVGLPWEIQIVWEQIINGNNAPKNKMLSMGATAYF